MPNTFLTSDSHFGEPQNRLDIMFRNFSSPEQHNQVIIDNWNQVVKPEDKVYHVGDFAYDKSLLTKDFVSQLNGKITLIRGNHDTSPPALLKTLFYNVKDSILLTYGKYKFFVNHFPSRGKKEYWNICGHVHSNWKVQKNMINVSVDVWQYTPIEISALPKVINAIENHYDEDIWAAYYGINTVHLDRGKDGNYASQLKLEKLE